MSGYRTIFIPGTDHAGISTQTKYERILKEQGVDRNKISDSEFIKKLHT
jgi:valyl-tRNA synthetase